MEAVYKIVHIDELEKALEVGVQLQEKGFQVQMIYGEEGGITIYAF